MILSLLYRTDPSQLRLVLIDPKMLEFSLYNGIPHLLCPVVTDMNKAASALKWLTREMDERYAVMSRVGVRHFTSYNERSRRRSTAVSRDPRPDGRARGSQRRDARTLALHRVRGRRTGRPHAHEPEGSRRRNHASDAEGPCGGDPPHSRDAAPVGRRGDVAHQGERADPHLLSGGERDRQPRHSGEAGAEQLLGNGDMLLHRPGDQGRPASRAASSRTAKSSASSMN